MDRNELNLIIAGIGGQGINSLAKVLAEFLLQSGYQCQFTIHKGGAQSLGSVFAEFRITRQSLNILGQGIPKNQLDILITLEPWEALRHVSLANEKTLLWVEMEAMPLFIERSNELVFQSPQEQLDSLALKIKWRTYRQIAQQQAGTTKMANYFAGLDCVSALQTAFKDDANNIGQALFDELFFKRIKKAKKI